MNWNTDLEEIIWTHLSPSSWTSLVAQEVKNLPAIQETQVQSLGREDPLEKGMTTHSSVLAWKNPIDRGAWRATVHGVTKSRHNWATFTFNLHLVVHELSVRELRRWWMMWTLRLFKRTIKGFLCIQSETFSIEIENNLSGLHREEHLALI